MYLKIKNKSFWNIACKQTDNIYSLLNIMITVLEQFTFQNFPKIYKFTDANCIIKNNRIFLVCSQKKIFTFNFPFVIVEKGVLFDGEIVDINIIKAMKRIIDIFMNVNSYEEFLLEYDSIDESEGFKVNEIQTASKILKKLLEIEIGYMRYDEDDKSAKKHGEEYHPKYHLDIFFDNNISCKIGIEKKSNINIEKIFDRLFDKKEEKFFLTNYQEKS